MLCSQPPASQKREVGGGSSSPGTPWLLQQVSFKGYLWLFSHSSSQEAALQLSSWLQRTPSCTGIGCTWEFGRSHPEGTRPARQAQSQRAASGVAPVKPSASAVCTTPHLREAEHPELLLNSEGAGAAQQRKVPALHLQHREMCSPRVGPDVITTAATPGSLFICSLVPEAPAAGAAPVEQLSHSPPRLLGKGWQLCLNPLSPAAGGKPLPDFVLKRLRWEHSCPILLTHRGGGKQQQEGNNKQLEGMKGEVTS